MVTKKKLAWYKQPGFRIKFAWINLYVSIVGLVVSTIFIFMGILDEPLVVMIISWYAITLTAWDVINTTDVYAGKGKK